MTHAERITEQKERVVEAAKASRVQVLADGKRLEGATDRVAMWLETKDARYNNHSRLDTAVDTLLALERETCPECGWREDFTFIGDRSAPYVPCPAGCDNGRKRA